MHPIKKKYPCGTSVDVGYAELEDDGYMYDYRGDKIHKIHTEYTFGRTGTVQETKCGECFNMLFWDSETEELYCPVCKE